MSYNERIDGYRYTRLEEAGFILLGFVLGIPGILIDWATARSNAIIA